MALDVGRFFRACNPSKTLNLTAPDDQPYHRPSQCSAYSEA